MVNPNLLEEEEIEVLEKASEAERFSHRRDAEKVVSLEEVQSTIDTGER